MKVPIDSIKFLEELYPRSGFQNEVVNSYRLNIENLPSIVITQERYLVDGYHRIIAHRLEGLTEINAEIIDIPKDKVLWEATKLNAQHGLQLSMIDKKRLARNFFKNNGCQEKEIADVLSVSRGTVSNWLTDLVQEAREEQKEQIITFYLQCLTQKEIADKIGYSQRGVSETIQKFKSEFSDKPPESLQLFNVWNFPNRNPEYGLDCKGQIPGQIVENLLYYYTKPFDVVVDPMAGGGTTIDVCKTMFRRYRAYDINPLREDICQHDILEGFPKECRNCDLIFLDPPYFNAMDTENPVFQKLEEFYAFIRTLAKHSYETVRKNGYLALLMLSKDNKGEDTLSINSARIFLETNFDCIEHISCPLTTQSANAHEINWAKENRRLLGRNRDLYIFARPN